MSLKSALLVGLALAGQASCAIIRILAQAAYDKADPFEFSPNEVTARVGDVLEFHFGGPGKGVLGGNHSVAQGVFGDPCRPAPNAWFSGYQVINGSVTESDFVWQVEVTSTAPMPFYCTQGQHCTRGMHGVVNGAGSQTLASYRAGITVNKDATAPARVGGGVLVPNNITNQIPKNAAVPATANTASLAFIVAAWGVVLLAA